MPDVTCPECKGDLLPDDIFCESCGALAKGTESYRNEWTYPQPNRLFSPPPMGDILLTATITASVLPFVQSMATEAGKDAYSKLKNRIARERRPPVAKYRKAVEVIDSDRNLTLSVNESISPDGAQELFRLDLAFPILRDGEIRWRQNSRNSDGCWWFYGENSALRWDSSRHVWVDLDGRIRSLGTLASYGESSEI